MTDTALSTDYVVADEPTTMTAEVVADVGNARTVVLVLPQGETTPLVSQFPSVRSLHGAFSWEVFAARGQRANAWGQLERDEHIIELGGHERFIGRLAVERIAASSSGRGSDERYVDGTTLDFVLTGIAAAVPRNVRRVVVSLTTMVPVGLWHLAPRVVEALRGKYEPRYNGREITIVIASVTVKREAEAAFAAIEGDTSGPVVIIDAGGRTVNIALFRDGLYRDGRTLELGVQAAFDNLDKALLGRGLRRLTLAERDELERALIRQEPYRIIVDGKAVDVVPLARAQLDETAQALATQTYACVPMSQARRVVFVGGGAHGPLFGDTMKQQIARIEIGGMKELANAYGALPAGATAPKKGKRK